MLLVERLTEENECFWVVRVFQFVLTCNAVGILKSGMEMSLYESPGALQDFELEGKLEFSIALLLYF